jgi:hypothetical protein
LSKTTLPTPAVMPLSVKCFFEAYVKANEGTITYKNGLAYVTYPDKPQETFTYCPSVSGKQNVPLLATGSPIFQQILRECQKNGVLCQIQLYPQENDMPSIIRRHFKDAPFVCIDCDQITVDKNVVRVCVKPQSCYHQINCGKIYQIQTGKPEAIRYFQFYYSIEFYNKLRSKSEEILTLLLDEQANIIEIATFDDEPSFISDNTLVVSECRGKVKPELFDKLHEVVDKQIELLLCDKVALFDLPLGREKKARLLAFEKRLKQERREQILSRKRDFDPLKWQNRYQTLLSREEETYLTNVSVHFINFLVINTYKVKFNILLDNKALVPSILTLGLNQSMTVICPVCKKFFTEGYATQDGLYVCGNCIKQSVDSGKVYSKKSVLSFDDTLQEYIEQNSGFVCSVCQKRYSRLLEFKCSHDNSSICIHHYSFCDTCGNEKIYSKNNLSYTDEFKHQLCPKHTKNLHKS